MRNAHRGDVVKLIEFGRTLPSCQGAGELCAALLAAAAELACRWEPDETVTREEFAKGIHVVYEANRGKPKVTS